MTTVKTFVENKFKDVMVGDVPFNNYYIVNDYGSVFGWNKYVGIYVSMDRNFFKANNNNVPSNLVDDLYDTVENFKKD
jgi:hypothetical protein